MNHLAKITLGYVAFCFLSLGVLVIVKAIYNVFLHPLRRYPGSKLWAATRLTWTYSMQSGQFHQHLHELHQQYGPIIRIAPNELSYIDARAWHDIYQPRAGHRHIPKTDKWGKQPPGAPDSIASVDVNAHTRIRRGLMGAFTEHAVNEHASMIESLVDLMIAKLTERATSSDDCATVDLVDWFNFLTFDIAGALSFGKSFESVQNGKAHPWVEITCTFGKGLALVASVNFFSPLDRLLAYTIPRTVREKMNYHKQLVHERFRQRLDREDKRTSPDFVGSVLQYNESKGSTRVTMEEMEANMMTLILAGSETTATVLAAATNALLRHPKVLEKVLGEVRSAFEVQQEITIATVGRLEYLTAVLQECLRLYPPAAVAIPRVIPKEGDIICEQWVPGTTLVAVNQFPAYRSTINFTSPDAFIPERFTPSTPFPADNMTAFEPFLVGRHKCLGQKFAWAEMRLTLARVLYSFDIAPAEQLNDFGKQNTYVFWEKKALRVKLVPRKIE